MADRLLAEDAGLAEAAAVHRVRQAFPAHFPGAIAFGAPLAIVRRQSGRGP